MRLKAEFVQALAAGAEISLAATMTLPLATAFSDDFFAPGACLLTPIPELETAADLLAAAADALLAGDAALARLKLRRAND